MSEIIDDVIKEAISSNKRKLIIKNFGLNSIPIEIGNCIDLQELNLIGNNLSFLPAELANLRNLESLHLSGNNFNQIPDVVFSLKNLKHLCVSDNKLSILPDEIKELSVLQELYLRNNKFFEFPNIICELSKLVELSLSNNNISKLPDEITKLMYLNRMYLENNQLVEFPDVILSMGELDCLYLNNNKINSVPINVSKLREINHFEIYGNNIETLPLTFRNADFWINVNLSGNSLDSTTNDLLNGGLGVIYEYLIKKEKGYTYNVPIDRQLKTAFKQYLVYFNDFVKVSKGIEIDFEVRNDNDGLLIDIKANDEHQLSRFQGYLEEYVSFIQTNIDKMKKNDIQFSYSVAEVQRELLIVDLKNQLRNLQTTIELRKVENRILNESVKRLSDIIMIEKSNPNPILIQVSSNSHLDNKVNNIIKFSPRSEIEFLKGDLIELKKILEETYPEILDEINDIEKEFNEIEVSNEHSKSINKIPFERLKKVIEELSNPDSTLRKTVKSTEILAKAVRKLGNTYNKFAEWFDWQQIPEIFF